MSALEAPGKGWTMMFTWFLDIDLYARSKRKDFVLS